MSRRARRSLRTPLLLLLAVIALNLAATIIGEAYRLLPLLLLTGLAWCGWQLARRRRVLPASGSAKVLPAQVMPDRNADLEAEVDDLRRQVAKLEDDAARNDELLGRLEAVTHRPAELHIADLERARRMYGPAAFGGKTGDRA
jgi:hypothetical protein